MQAGGGWKRTFAQHCTVVCGGGELWLPSPALTLVTCPACLLLVCHASCTILLLCLPAPGACLPCPSPCWSAFPLPGQHYLHLVLCLQGGGRAWHGTCLAPYFHQDCLLLLTIYTIPKCLPPPTMCPSRPTLPAHPHHFPMCGGLV